MAISKTAGNGESLATWAWYMLARKATRQNIRRQDAYAFTRDVLVKIWVTPKLKGCPCAGGIFSYVQINVIAKVNKSVEYYKQTCK